MGKKRLSDENGEPSDAAASKRVRVGSVGREELEVDQEEAAQRTRNEEPDSDDDELANCSQNPDFVPAQLVGI